MKIQTNLRVFYKNGTGAIFSDVHPDNRYEIEGGLLTFEERNGARIHYIVSDNVESFFTYCVEV